MAGKATCPDCCGTCTIAEDDFNRADSDSLGGNWSEEAGDADIDATELLWSSTGIIIHQTVHPGGPTAPVRIRVRFKRTSAGEYARGIVGWQDSSNYLYASVETVSGCDVLRLFQVVGGVTTEVQDAQTIGDGATLDQWHILEVCLKIVAGYYYAGGEDIFRAKVTLASGKVYGTQARSGDYAGGDKVGLAGSTDVRMDDFRFDWMKSPGFTRCQECKTPCEIETDSFLGGVETPCKWSGALMRVFHPENDTEGHVDATVDLQSGESAEIRVNAKGDMSAYHWARISLAGTVLTLSIGKTGTTLDTVTGTFAGGTITICAEYQFGTIEGSSNGMSLAVESAVVTDGIYSGRSGTADWSEFTFSKIDDINCPGTCGGTQICETDQACPGGLRPQFLLIEIPVTQWTPEPACANGYNCLETFAAVVLEYSSSFFCDSCSYTEECGYGKCLTLQCNTNPALTTKFGMIAGIGFDETTGETVVTVSIYRNVGILGCSEVLFAQFEYRIVGQIDCTTLDVTAPYIGGVTPDDAGSVCLWTASGPARVRAI